MSSSFTSTSLFQYFSIYLTAVIRQNTAVALYKRKNPRKRNAMIRKKEGRNRHFLSSSTNIALNAC